MLNRIPVLVVVLVLATGFAGLATADLYKWTDAEGKVHYSDQPPPANVKQSGRVKAQKPAIAAPPVEGDAKPAAKTYQEQDAEFKQRKVEEAEKAAADRKSAQDAVEKQRNCEQARLEVKRLQDGGRLSRYNDKGETEYLSEAQIAEELGRARQIADSWCK